MLSSPITFEGITVRIPEAGGVRFRVEGGVLSIECTGFTGSIEMLPEGGAAAAENAGLRGAGARGPSWLRRRSGEAPRRLPGGPVEEYHVQERVGAEEEGGEGDSAPELPSQPASEPGSQPPAELPLTQPEQSPSQESSGGRKRGRGEGGDATGLPPAWDLADSAADTAPPTQLDHDGDDGAGTGASDHHGAGGDAAAEALPPGLSAEGGSPSTALPRRREHAPAGALAQEGGGGARAPTGAQLASAPWSAQRVVGDTAAPSARWGHAAAPLGDGRVLVYGGQDGDGATLGDVHVFDAGGEWTRPANAASTPRRWHSATHVPHRRMVITFGGESPSAAGDSELVDSLMVLDADLMLWYAPTVSGPPPAARAGHTAVLMGRHIVLFGGCRRRKWTSEVFVLDTDMWSWERRKIGGLPPKPRVYHTATVVGGKMIVFGGNDEDRSFNDVHVLDTSSDLLWRWEQPCCVGDVPAPRTGHVACRVGDAAVLVHGGWDPQVEEEEEDESRGGEGGGAGPRAFADAFLLDTEAWEWTRVQVEGSGCMSSWPFQAAGHACVASAGGSVTLFGGQRAHGELRGDVVRISAAAAGAEAGEAAGEAPYGLPSKAAAPVPAAKRARRRLLS